MHDALVNFAWKKYCYDILSYRQNIQVGQIPSQIRQGIKYLHEI